MCIWFKKVRISAIVFQIMAFILCFTNQEKNDIIILETNPQGYTLNLLSLEWRLSFLGAFILPLSKVEIQCVGGFDMFFIQNVNLNGEATLILVIGVLILGYFIIMKKQAFLKSPTPYGVFFLYNYLKKWYNYLSNKPIVLLQKT